MAKELSLSTETSSLERDMLTRLFEDNDLHSRRGTQDLAPVAKKLHLADLFGSRKVERFPHLSGHSRQLLAFPA